jgi:NAD(P)-dependent dehydrogenase (short-subunit alcohol dehydrogenase family)
MSRVAYITGAAGAIGRAIAARLAREGWRLVLADHDVAVEPLAAGLGARADVFDLADEAALAASIAALDAREARLDALVSNAGINANGPLETLTLAAWNRVLATNLTAAFLLAREAAPLLRAARGSIVAIASTRAHMSEPDTEAYSASKGGLLALTHALAASLAPDVRVNCISPGWIARDQGALRPEDHAQHFAGRVGTPDDIAAMVAYLAGPDAGFVTGAEFTIDGGMTRKMIYLP